MIKRFYTFLFLLCVMVIPTSLTSQDLACNNHINVGVNFTCTIDLTIDMFLEGDTNISEDIQDPAYTYVIYNLANQPFIWGNYAGPTQIDGIILDANLKFEVYYNNWNVCWGTVLFEDKIAPQLDCDCPVGGQIIDNSGKKKYHPDCVLNCWELPVLKDRYWDRLRDELIPEDVGDFVDDNADDNCDGLTEDDVSYFDVFEDLGCNGSLLRRTWTVTYATGYDGSTSTKSCVREYYFRPIGLEAVDTARMDPVTGLPVPEENKILLPFHVVKMNCGTDINPWAISQYFDNPVSKDQDTDDNRIMPDELDIDNIIENNEGIAYAYPHFYTKGRNPFGPHAQPIDNTVCNILTGYTDQDIEICAPGCNGNRKVLRSWTILDWCSGEFIQYGQVIKVIDLEGPDIDVEDVSVSVDPWKCEADVQLPHPDHLNDYCDNFVTYWIGSVTGGLTITGNPDIGYVMHNAQHDVTYRVEYLSEDCCGNLGRNYIDVHIVDYTPPVPVTKEFITTSLANISNPIDGYQGIAKVYAQDVDNGSYDGCTAITIAVRRQKISCSPQDTIWGDFVRFCCEDLEGKVYNEIDVEFRVTDAYGNKNYAWSTIRLEDKSSATQTCPDDLVLTCDMDYNDFTMTGLPRVYASCGELFLDCDLDELVADTEPRRKGPNDGYFGNPKYDGQEVPAYDPSCGYGAIRRQFKSCSSCTQWFVIEPINPFNSSSISFPNDMIIDCDDYDTGEPDWSHATCNLIGVSVESDTFIFEDGACFKVLNHWTIIDWCTYDPSNPLSFGKWEYTQVIKLIDTQDPILTAADSLCFQADEDCYSSGIRLSAFANDEGKCGSEWMKWEVTVDLNSDWTPDYYFGSDLPRYSNGAKNPYYIEPSGNNEKVHIDLPDGIHASNVWHRVVWRVSDGCGNIVSSVRYFQIGDKKAPTPYCLNLSTAVMSTNGQVELWAIDFNVNSFDNCTADENLWFTFTGIAPPPRDDSEYDSSSDLQWYNGTFWYFDAETGEYMDQDDYFDQDADRWDASLRSSGRIFTADDADSSGMAMVPLYVWDQNGNVDFCLVRLRIIDNMGVGEGRIAGDIVTEIGEEVEGVMTELRSDNPSFPEYYMTDSDGDYAFENVPFNEDYVISGQKNDDILNGVSTLDLLLIQRHVLGQEILDSPYKMIAADINNDKQISSIDLIELRKMILGIHTEFPNNTSWKVIDADNTLNIINPWNYKEKIDIKNFRTDMEDGDFIGVKIGDVNGSARANFGMEEEELKSSILFDYNENYISVGEIVELDLISNTKELYGFQFTLSLDNFELIEVTGDAIEDHNFAVFEDRLTMSYHSENVIANRPVTFILQAKNEGNLSELLEINSDITKAEAYIGSELNVTAIDLGEKTKDIDFALYQNNPNPFSTETKIGFTLPDQSPASLTLFDITGKKIKSYQLIGNKGYNELVINTRELAVNGMIYYTLETSENIATRHMIVIE